MKIRFDAILGKLREADNAESVSNGYKYVDSYTPTNGQTSFTLSNPVDAFVHPILEVNGGVQKEGTDYTISGTTLTWLDTNFTLTTTDLLTIYYS